MTAEKTRSWEFAAIPITIVVLGMLGVLMWAFVEGAWAWVAVGIALLVVLVVAAIAYTARPHHPSAPRAPALPDGAAPHREDGIHRILLVADDACEPQDLAPAITESRAADRLEVLVIAPALGSRTARWTGDDHAYRDAEEHLEVTLEALDELRVEARGHVGAHDPLQAVEDGLREFPADEIVLAVHPAGRTNWLEEGVADDARSRYPCPVRVVTVGGGDGIEPG